MEQPEHELAPILDAGIMGSGFTHYATVPAITILNSSSELLKVSFPMWLFFGSYSVY